MKVTIALVANLVAEIYRQLMDAGKWYLVLEIKMPVHDMAKFTIKSHDITAGERSQFIFTLDQANPRKSVEFATYDGVEWNQDKYEVGNIAMKKDMEGHVRVLLGDHFDRIKSRRVKQ